MNRKTVNGLCIAGMIISWAIYYAISKWAVVATNSAFLAGLLLRSAALIFLTVQLLIKHKFKKLFYQGKTALILLAIGVFGYLLDAFANVGYAHSTLSTGAALLKSDVLMANVATILICKQRLHLSDWIGTVVMLVGVFLVLDINWINMRFNWYDLFFLASALSVTINAFVIKAAQEKRHVDTDMIAYYNNFVVMVLFLVSSLMAGDVAHTLERVDFSFCGLVALGGLAQTFIYFFYYRNLQRYEVWIVKLYLLFMPILSCFIGAFFFGERLSVAKVCGVVVVLVGAAMILLREKLNRGRFVKHFEH